MGYSPAGVALLSQGLLRGPQIALTPCRSLGRRLGATTSRLITVFVAHGLDIAATAHAPARDRPLSGAIHISRGQQRGAPLSPSAGHLEFPETRLRWDLGASQVSSRSENRVSQNHFYFDSLSLHCGLSRPRSPSNSKPWAGKTTWVLEVSLEDSEDGRGTRGSLEGNSQHRANTTMHVCWYRNTSVSRADHSAAVEVWLS